MRAKMLALSLLVGFLMPSPSFSTDDPETRKTLIGIPGVFVLVEELGQDMQRIGLTTTQIRTDVELRVRREGIRVLTEDEWNNSRAQGSSSLTIDAEFHDTGSGHNVGCGVLHVGVLQGIRLVRDNSVNYVETWSTQSIGLVNLNDPRQFRNDLLDRVDRFINAYLAANPRQR